MITAIELREILKNFPKYPGTKFYPPASVCNDGFPGTFNLSWAEAEHLEKFNSYIDFSENFIYSKFQPVIRHNDWEIILKNSKDRWRYLSLFEIVDISAGISLKDANEKKKEELLDFCIKSFIDLLKKLKVDLSDVYVKIFTGGDISKVTAGKYNFKKTVPPFDLSKKIWSKYGISEKNFIADKTRDSFLALKIYGMPTGWGYRNEVFIKHKDFLLDIGTVGWLIWKAVYDGTGEIIDFTDWENCFSIAGIGLERLEMAINKLDSVMQCSHILPLYQKIISLGLNDAEAQILTEALRTIHRINTDCGDYKNLGRKRKEKIRDYYKAIFSLIEKYKISIDTLKELLTLNASLQNYYPELSSGINTTLAEIKEQEKRFTEDKSVKAKGV